MRVIRTSQTENTVDLGLNSVSGNSFSYTLPANSITTFIGSTTPIPCIDTDGDYYGNSASALCLYSSLDCNNTNPNINPGAAEICDDGSDNDCDGNADLLDTDCQQASTFNCSNPHPDWIFCDDFERVIGDSPRDSQHPWCYNPSNSGTPTDPSDDYCVSNYQPTCGPSQSCADISGDFHKSGTRALRIWYPSGNTGSAAREYLGLVGDLNVPSPGLDEIYIRYYRYFPSNWMWYQKPTNDLREMHNVMVNAGNFVPGNMSQADLTIYQEHHCQNQLTPHYVEMSVNTDLQTGVWLPYPLVNAIPDRSVYYLAPYNPNITFTVGKWYEIQYYVKLNSFNGGSPNPDAVITYWVDGNLVINWTSLILRDGLHQNIKFHSVHIGTNRPDGVQQDQSSYFDDFIVSTSFINVTSQQSTSCDSDSDGFNDLSCSGNDCNDYDSTTQDCHPADSSNNGCVDNNELLEFIDAWKAKGTLIIMPELMMAIKIWKGCSQQ